MAFKGMGFELDDEEKVILSVFKGRDYVAVPVDCGLSMSKTMQVLHQLTKRQIIKGRGPYQLTKLGKRIVENL